MERTVPSMDVRFITRRTTVTDRFREYAEERLERAERLAPHAQRIDVKASEAEQRRGAPSKTVEVTVIGTGPVVRAEATAGDVFSAFDLAQAKLLERLRRAKERRVDRGRGRAKPLASLPVDPGPIAPVSPSETPSNVTVAEDERVDDENESPLVIRRKTFAAHPITLDEALSEMELVGHDFYLFVDAETGRPSVAYRRKAWDFGVISLDTSGASDAA